MKKKNISQARITTTRVDVDLQGLEKERMQILQKIEDAMARDYIGQMKLGQLLRQHDAKVEELKKECRMTLLEMLDQEPEEAKARTRIYSNMTIALADVLNSASGELIKSLEKFGVKNLNITRPIETIIENSRALADLLVENQSDDFNYDFATFTNEVYEHAKTRAGIFIRKRQRKDAKQAKEEKK